MKSKLVAANAAIDSYIEKLSNPNENPFRTASFYFQKFLLEEFGVITDARKLDLLDHCTIFPACVIACGRVREVSQIERRERAVHPNQSFEKGIRKLRRNPSLNQRLEQNVHKIKDENKP